MKYIGAVASSVLSLLAMTDATVRGADYLKTPFGEAGTGPLALHDWVSTPHLGIIFLCLGVVGMAMCLLRKYVPSALIHAALAGIFLTMGVLSIGPAIVVGYGFRMSFSYVFIYAAVHLVCAAADNDRWWCSRGGG